MGYSASVAWRRLISSVLFALVATVVLPAGAQASSVVYIKRGDVWLANSGGSAQRPLTRDGSPRNPYRSPAYSNRGVITAVKGRRDIHFFNTRGKRIRKKRDISGGPTPPFDSVIIDHSISPDGRRLASTLWLTSRAGSPRPGEPQGTDYSTSVWYTRVKDGRLHSKGTTDGGQSVTWASSGMPIVFAPYVYHSADAWVVDLNRPNDPRQWFQDRATVNVLDPSDGEPLDDGELTRGRDKIAVVRGPNTTASSGQTMIRIYAVPNLFDRPAERCDLRAAPNTRIESPSWSPDGDQLAWSERGGIWISPISDGAGDCGAAPRLLIRGGSQPDWGPANAPARRRR
jgi:WD40-like Beta Propeller Repeat